jgi:hypothetical protein
LVPTVLLAPEAVVVVELLLLLLHADSMSSTAMLAATTGRVMRIGGAPLSAGGRVRGYEKRVT